MLKINFVAVLVSAVVAFVIGGLWYSPLLFGNTYLTLRGAHAGWWFKTVQLDLEAKHEIVRERTSPLRVRRA